MSRRLVKKIFFPARPQRLLTHCLAATLLVAALIGSPKSWSEDPQTRSQADLLERLKEIEAELKRIREAEQKAPPGETEHRLAVMLEDSFLGAQHRGNQNTIRYLATRLVLLNLEDQPLTVDPDSIRLLIDGKEWKLAPTPQELQAVGFSRREKYIALKEMHPPSSIQVLPGEPWSAWLLFSGFDNGPFIPEMTLAFACEGEERKIDVNLYHQGLLGLRTRQIGPNGCLDVLTITGELDTINVGALVGYFSPRNGRHISRAVITWAESAPQPDSFMRSWLSYAARTNPYRNTQYSQMPDLPTTLKELHFANLPEGTSIPSARSHKTVDLAIRAALAQVYRSSPEAVVLKSIRDGGEWERLAALEHGATRLSNRAYPIIEKLTHAEQPEVQRLAIAALGQFRHPEALETLRQYAIGSDPQRAEAALKGLVTSRFPEAYQVAQDVLESGPALKEKQVLSILSTHPRGQWTDTILRFCGSGKADVRNEAIKAIATLGHPNLTDILADALDDPNENVQKTAFAELAKLRDPRAERLSVEFALQQLEKSLPARGDTVYAVLSRTREQRAVPLLIEYLKKKSSSHTNTIMLLAEVGDQSVGDLLAERFDHFSAADKVQVLNTMERLGSDRMQELALRGLKSDNDSLVSRSVNYLQQHPNEETVKALIAMIDATPSDKLTRLNTLINGLGYSGGLTARKKLVLLRKSKNEDMRRRADQALRTHANRSPASGFIRTADSALKMGRKDQALEYLDMAEKVDSQHLQLYTTRAKILYLFDRKYDQAIEQLNKVLALDPEDLTALRLMGDVLYAAKRYEQAVTYLQSAIQQMQWLNKEKLNGNSRAYTTLGHCLAALSRYEDAIAQFKKAVELDPSDDIAITGRAIAMAQMGHEAEAVQYAESHAQKFRDDFTFNYNMACVYARAMEQVRDDPNRGSQHELVEKYTNKAIHYLEKSLKQGFADFKDGVSGFDGIKHMQQDPDLKSLHQHPKFRELAQLDKAAADSETKPEQNPRPKQNAPQKVPPNKALKPKR